MVSGGGEGKMGDESIREACAAVQHEIWSSWMRYLFETTIDMGHNGLAISPSNVIRWARQMNTPYDELSEEEKESDRHQADKILSHCDLRVWYD